MGCMGCMGVHGLQVRGVLYNAIFSVVVSADENGTVCVWNITNGQREGRFMKAHGDAKVGHDHSWPLALLGP
jgi:hypothetical protein